MTEHDAILDEIDTTSLAIFTTLLRDATSNARGSVQSILQASSKFLTDEAHAALKNFHDLYFHSGSEDGKPAAANHNDDVTRIFDEASAIVAGGGEGVDASLNNIAVDQSVEKDRLAISGLQKKLEAVIAMEANFREKIGSILSSMQFEDAMSQRAAHIEKAWTDIVAALAQRTVPAKPLSAEIAGQLSSASERRTYYEKVLHETPPEQEEERSIWLDFAA